MKHKLIPVVLTAAITSVATLFIAAKLQNNVPYIGQAPPKQLPVNYTYTASGATRAGAPVDFQLAAESSVKAVVHIKTQTKARAVVADDMFGRMFGQQYYIPPQMGSGSGVVVSPDGYIATNNHVVAGADEVTVTFNDRYTAQAKVIATDPSTDIAVLKVNEKNLPFIEFGNSDDVQLGQWVLAAGYPLTLDATVTAGIVSAKGRALGINRAQSTNAIEAFIQTDAAVNPGNSGGALVNTDGQLIGINSAIASPTGSYAGYSYAIPSNLVRKVVNDLMQYGSVQRGYLGIMYADRRMRSPEELTKLGIDRADGVYVDGTTDGSGAAAAGIRQGDFIVKINDVDIHTEPQLQEQIARYKPGDNISITYVRNGATKVTTVQLKNIEGNTNIIRTPTATRALGANFRALSGEEKKRYNIEGGLLVTDISRGAISQQTNMKKGFVITSVNEQPVASIDDLQKHITAHNGKAQIAGFYPGTRGMFYYGLNGITDLEKEQ
jgi:Trypsin-like serine proteases, typically periplasmic, contain C-terminal PDZ domain